MNVDLSGYRNPHGLLNRAARVIWRVVWLLLFRPSPAFLHSWRRLLLRLFGATIGKGAHPYPSARIWAPWNLTMGVHSCLGRWTDCYSVDKINIGAHAVVSQYAFLCTAGHDHRDRGMRLVTSPIRIGEGAWIAAGAFVGPGVSVGEGAVVGARAVATRSVDPWTIVAGNPARLLGRRELASKDVLERQAEG
ncbi:MAG: LbetaH domain-containing protein [Planctomycetota bacterium]